MALKNTVDYFAEDAEEKKDATEEAIEVFDTSTVDDFAEDENAETLPYVVECRVHKTVCNYKTLAEAQADAKGWDHCRNFCGLRKD